MATSLNQFCRSIGSTLGSAVFGSILILRFVTGLNASVPPPVANWLDTPTGAGLRDPQTVLSPNAAEALRDQLAIAFPNSPEFSNLVLKAIQDSLASALHLVFFIGALVMVCGLIASIVWREIPMRRISRPTPSGASESVNGAVSGTRPHRQRNPPAAEVDLQHPHLN